MKKHLLAGVVVAGLVSASTAFAADLPRRSAAPPVVPVAVPIFTWTGFYVGVNAGYGFGTNDDATVFVPGIELVNSGGGDDSGFVGGGQIGYNYQIGQFVLGLETDIQFADLSNDRNDAFVGAAPFFGAGGGAGLDYFGTVRARAGFAIDRALVYATGGFAYGGGGSNNNNCFVGTVFTGCGGDDTATGWTLGGGLEYAFTNNLTAKIEGLYVNLDRGSQDVVDPAAGVVFPGSDNTEFGVVRAGLNYKF